MSRKLLAEVALIAALLVSACCTKLPAQTNTYDFNPGAIWLDSSGDPIQAHAPGIIKVGRTWYWFGEDKTHGSPFQNIRCYASEDLAHWRYISDALTQQASGDLGPNRVVERPKVIYNRRTRTYVMYVHIDNMKYAEAKVGVATSQTVEGPYSYLGSFSPFGHISRDETLFQDGDGTGYLIYEDRNRGVSITQLSPDYLTAEREITLIPEHYEAPAMIKVGGIYYLLGSHLSGWATNDNEYTTAASIAGPWSPYREVAPSSPNTFNSQTAFILPVFGKKTTSYVYLGDRWTPSNLSDSRYVWLPLQIGRGSMLLPSDSPWSINVKSGVISEPYPAR